MGEFKHQHTADLSASLTCSTMSLGVEQLDAWIDGYPSSIPESHTDHQTIDDSMKILLMKLLVKALHGISRFDPIILMAEELLTEKPRCIYLHYALGTAFSKNKENDKAIYHCQRFIDTLPDARDAKFKEDNLATVHNNLAVCLKNGGFFDRAEENFQSALNIDDTFAAAHNNYGNLLNDQARLKEAQQRFLKAIELDPEDHIAYWNLHSTAASSREAQAIVEMCISKSPNDEIALFTLAGLQAFEGNTHAFEELIRFGFGEEPLVRSIAWILSLPNTPSIHFNRWSMYDHAISIAPRSRPFYEFGVWMGDSFKYLAPHFSQGFGFDTFQGLPEDWGVVPKGTYSSKGRVPNIPNSTFLVGEFEETLPSFFATNREASGLINFDADLYSSTITALTQSREIIDENTVLIFDEFIVNENWEQDEFRALSDFCQTNHLEYEVIAVSLFTKQAICKIRKRN